MKKAPAWAFFNAGAVIQSADMETTDFFSLLLDNQIRARILRLFLNAEDVALGVDEVARRVQGTKVAVERELQALMQLGVVAFAPAEEEGKAANKGAWSLDRGCRQMQALRRFSRDIEGSLDEEILGKLSNVGRLKFVAISNDLLDVVNGCTRIDMLIVGEALREEKVQEALQVVEAEWGREIQYAAFSPKEFKYRLDVKDKLMRDLLDYPHRVILDKLNAF